MVGMAPSLGLGAMAALRPWRMGFAKPAKALFDKVQDFFKNTDKFSTASLSPVSPPT